MTTRTEELKHRVQAKRKTLEAKLEKLQADASASSADAAQRIRNKIKDLDRAAEEGWDSLKDRTIERVNAILKDDDDA